MSYVWCNKEQCRIPAFRCLLCRKGCYPDLFGEEETKRSLENLIKSGKFGECFVMKRKENSKADTNKSGAANNEKPIFLLDDGKLVPFEPEQYTASVLYQMMESFTVECKLVRPNDPTNLQYEGKRPSKKTIPILVMKDEKCVLLDSWEDLEANPEQLSDVIEVMGAVPVKQVFVLKRK